MNGYKTYNLQRILDSAMMNGGTDWRDVEMALRVQIDALPPDMRVRLMADLMLMLADAQLTRN